MRTLYHHIALVCVGVMHKEYVPVLQETFNVRASESVV